MVEDNAVNMTIAVAMLEQWGVTVEQAVDGAQALGAVELAAARGPAVRPGADGRADAGDERLRGDARAARDALAGATLPIIALTAAALTSEREQALASGMNGFLTKPIDARKLHDTLVASLVTHGVTWRPPLPGAARSRALPPLDRSPVPAGDPTA